MINGAARLCASRKLRSGASGTVPAASRVASQSWRLTQFQIAEASSALVPDSATQAPATCQPPISPRMTSVPSQCVNQHSGSPPKSISKFNSRSPRGTNPKSLGTTPGGSNKSPSEFAMFAARFGSTQVPAAGDGVGKDEDELVPVPPTLELLDAAVSCTPALARRASKSRIARLMTARETSAGKASMARRRLRLAWY